MFGNLKKTKRLQHHFQFDLGFFFFLLISIKGYVAGINNERIKKGVLVGVNVSIILMTFPLMKLEFFTF